VQYFLGPAGVAVRRHCCHEDVRPSAGERQPPHISTQQEVLWQKMSVELLTLRWR